MEENAGTPENTDQCSADPEIKQKNESQEIADTLAAEIQDHMEVVINHLLGQPSCSQDWTDQLNAILNDPRKNTDNEAQTQPTPETTTTEEQTTECQEVVPATRLVQWATLSPEQGQALASALRELQLNKVVEALEALSPTCSPEATETEKDAVPEQQQAEEKGPDEETNVTTSSKSSARPYKDVLRESRGTFIDTLKLDKTLLKLLEESSVFNEEMVSKVLCRPNRPDKVRELMNFMAELGPHSVGAFIAALRATHQHYLANILAAYDYI